MRRSNFTPWLVLRLALWLAFAVLWAGGVTSHFLFGSAPREMAWTAPVFLALAAALVISSRAESSKAFLVSAAGGFAIEVLGVSSGFPFGRYRYTGVLGPALIEVPLIMAGAWLILLAWVRQLRLPVWAGALVMTMIDLTIDPVAVNVTRFWLWNVKGAYYGVPFTNFAGWFIASFAVLALLARCSPGAMRDASTLIVGCSILAFFVLIALAHSLWAPAVIGAAVCGSGFLRWRSETA